MKLSKLNSKLAKGFTLIELLIVIAILAVLAAGILVLIDPIDKMNQANDARVQNDIGAIGRAAEAYATMHEGDYPTQADYAAEMVDSGELKRFPEAPTGYTSYVYVEGVGVYGELKSKRFYNSTADEQESWYYSFADGSSKAVTTSELPTLP